VFRGALEVRASAITEPMAIAASHAIAQRATEQGLGPERIVPRMDDPELAVRVAVAVAAAAMEQGIARAPAPIDRIARAAAATITRARRTARALVDSGVVQPR
jgi:malate dehydrogenase (oxaloacetate-decarboxylating)